jgi:hypothetical protein
MTTAARCTVLAMLLLGCGGTPARPVTSTPGPADTASPAHATPRPDPCAGVPSTGKTSYAFQGLLRGARCDAEVDEIMTETARALGVSCDHCHVPGDFRQPTRNKEIATWMAIELVPTLRRRGGGAVTCVDCHGAGGANVARVLGSPRRHAASVEWMTTVLVERFETAAGEPLYCRTCHLENVGLTGFTKAVIFTDHLPPRAISAPGHDD